MPVKNGDTVSVHYVGTLNDGSEFDRSSPNNPLRFKVGSGQVIPGFDKAVINHEAGDKFSVTIPAAEAYGSHRPDLVFTVPRERLPVGFNPAVGMRVHMTSEQSTLEAVVNEMDDKQIKLDANHPMAGKDLTFALEIVSVN